MRSTVSEMASDMGYPGKAVRNTRESRDAGTVENGKTIYKDGFSGL
jgi:hypothetical protein